MLKCARCVPGLMSIACTGYSPKDTPHAITTLVYPTLVQQRNQCTTLERIPLLAEAVGAASAARITGLAYIPGKYHHRGETDNQ